MTGIDGYNWGSVGWTNPIPGDPDVVRGIGGQFADLADNANQQSSLLSSVGSDASGVWKGGAADAFHPTVAKLPGQLDKLVTSYRDAGNALKEGPKKKKRRGRKLLLVVVTAGVALAVSEGLRNKLLDALFGKEEEFEYTSTTSPPTPAPSPA